MPDFTPTTRGALRALLLILVLQCSSAIPESNADPNQQAGANKQHAPNPEPPTGSVIAGTIHPSLKVTADSDTGHAGEEGGAEWWKTPDGLLAAFTGVLVVVGFLQWNANRLQLQVLRNQESAMRATQRAYVGMDAIEVVEAYFLPVFSITIIRPRWTNSGDTPTLNMRSRVSWLAFDSLIADDYSFPDINRDAGEGDPKIEEPGVSAKAGYLGPRASIDGEIIKIPNDLIKPISAGTKHVYIWGRAEYGDVLSVGSDKGHKTEFCYKVSVLCSVAELDAIERYHDNRAEKDLHDLKSKIAFVLHPRHNSAD